MADPTDAQEEGTEEAPPKRNFRRELEERATNAEARVAELEKKIALKDTGLGLSDRQAAALLSVHEGDLTAEALKATATDLGFGVKAAEQSTSTASETKEQIDPAVQAELAELGKLADSPAQHESPRENMTQELFDQKVRSFKTEKELDAFLRANIHALPYG